MFRISDHPDTEIDLGRAGLAIALIQYPDPTPTKSGALDHLAARAASAAPVTRHGLAGCGSLLA